MKIYNYLYTKYVEYRKGKMKKMVLPDIKSVDRGDYDDITCCRPIDNGNIGYFPKMKEVTENIIIKFVNKWGM